MMPINIDRKIIDKPFILCEWTSDDLDVISTLIAYLLLGRFAHAQKVQNDEDTQTPNFTDNNIDNAIKQIRFSATLADDVSIIHRDGWLFQFISWIVSKIEYPVALIKAPQPRPADKGFDGLIISMDGSKIDFVVICEDKATENPRGTITDSVWPEFTVHEDGKRDNELVSEVTSLLSQRSGLDVHELTRSADWFKEKRYRASVTTSEQRMPRKVHTFENYQEVVNGNDARRLANLFIHDDMRKFFAELSDLVVVKLEGLRPK